MQTYLSSLLFSSQNNIPTTQQIDKVLRQLQSDNNQIEKQLEEYEQKIAQLPLEIRRKIHEQQYVPEELVGGVNFKSGRDAFGQKQEGEIQSPHSPNIFVSIVDKNLLEQKLKNLQDQQDQIDYISKLSDMYIRCKKQPQTIISLENTYLDQQKPQQSRHTRLNHHNSTLQRQELQETAEFIKSIKPYSITKDLSSVDNYHLVNDLISNMKLHTAKKLTEKCENLVHYGPSGSNYKIVIEKFLIKNSKSIILGQEENEREGESTVNNQTKFAKIITKFIEKILGDVMYYDVSCQKIILMQVIDSQIAPSNLHSQTITRKKIYFPPSQTQKHFQQIKLTLSHHLLKAQELKSLFFPSQNSTFSLIFDKILQRQVSQIKSNLQYILPYINIKSRKVLMEVLTDGKDEVMEFQDLVLRLKFKGQDGEMFMNNLDAVFGRLIDIREVQQSESQEIEIIRFNQKNFELLTNFFELGIFQAQQSLLQTSSKAIKKLTTNFASLHSRQKPSTTSKHTSKKLFNMIFFSVSNLIERFDELLEKEEQKFSSYSRNLGMMYEEKVGEWVDKLIEIRENVRKRIHEE